MGKRIAIKTTLVCFGIFLILNSLIFLYIFKKYPPDTEQHITVVTAAVDIEEGTVIQEKHLKLKEIQQSASNSVMLTDESWIVGRKAVRKISKDDYIRANEVVSRENWYQNEDRVITLPASIEERLANLIKKGSYIDILLQKETSQEIETILEKVKVHDMLDEFGIPFDSNTAVNSKISYMKLVLGEKERQKLYLAKSSGRLVFELYCDSSQK